MKMRLKLLIVACLAFTNVAEAAESEARQLVAEGIHLRDDKNDYDGALKLFQRAYQLEPSPMALGQIGTVEYLLHRWDESEEYVVAALAAASDDWVGRYRGMLEKVLVDVRLHVGDLAVTGGAPGAQIYVNGRGRGVLPLAKPLRVTAGAAAVQVTAAGYQPFVGSTTVTPGVVTQLNVAMERLKLLELSLPPRDAAEGASKLRLAAWIAAGAAVAGLGVGIVGQVVRNHRLDDFNGSCRIDAASAGKPTRYPSGGAGPDPCQGLYDSWNASKPWPVVGYVSAGAFAVTSAALFVVTQRDEAGVKRARLDCSVAVGFAGCGGVF